MGKKERIEQAVIDLDGEWPEVSKRSYQDDYRGYFVGPLSGHLRWSPGDGSKRLSICTYPEFMDARARLENKPSWHDVPGWVEWVAQSPCGHWEGYSAEPWADSHWAYSDSERGEIIAPGVLFGDWHQSLERRPDNKEGEGVEWDGEGLPPVGIECEALVSHGASTRWRRAEILKHGVRECAVCVPEIKALVWCNTFRPIQSHRDRVIKAAMEEVMVDCTASEVGMLAGFVERLYDVDMLKLPEGEE